MAKNTRARSREAKQERRDAILDAARVLIEDVGFDGVTMSALAARAGVSKGTLYLYVRTKEEVFLALFVDAMGTLVEQIETQATRETLVEVLSSAPQEVPLFLPLLARIAATIETNVADIPLFDAKRTMHAYGARVAILIAGITGAPREKAGAISSTLMLAMQGAAQFDITAQRPPETLPEDLRPIYASQVFADRFPPAARLILASVL